MLAAPRTDPGVRCYRTGLLSRMIDEKPFFRPQVLDYGVSYASLRM